MLMTQGESSPNTKVKSGVPRRIAHSKILYFSLLLVCVFWFGVFIANTFISSKIAETCKKSADIPQSQPTKAGYGSQRKSKMMSVNRVEKRVPPAAVDAASEEKALLLVKPEPTIEEALQDKKKKLILLYGRPIWTKYDLWKSDDWEKCPRQDCVISTDLKLFKRSSAVIFNAQKMPVHGEIQHLLHEKQSSPNPPKFVFMSGITPAESYFSSDTFDGFFDLTMTYKADSDIRIPFWPNNGILPTMMRPKTPSKKFSEQEINRFKDENRYYYAKEGKDEFMLYVIKTCDSKLFANLMAMRLRWEGTISILSHKPCNATLMGFPDIEYFPCEDLYSDACSKFMEKFKFVILPEMKACKDYIHRDYWYSLKAWQAVPILWGSDKVKEHAIPGSFIDALAEEYLSPIFKEALNAKEDGSRYSKYMLWKEEDRVEEYHWQCELCEKLHTMESRKTERSSVSMSEFWNAEEDCGVSSKVHKNLRGQLLRTGAIR